MEIKNKPAYLAVNAITYSRILMAFGIVVASLQNNLGAAGLISVGQLITDKVDGVMARVTNTTSKIGAIRDEIADMYFTSAVGLSIGIFSGRLPSDLIVPGVVASIFCLLPILLNDVPDVLNKLNNLKKSNISTTLNPN